MSKSTVNIGNKNRFSHAANSQQEVEITIIIYEIGTIDYFQKLKKNRNKEKKPTTLLERDTNMSVSTPNFGTGSGKTSCCWRQPKKNQWLTYRQQQTDLTLFGHREKSAKPMTPN